jgi:hypothetical protein
MRPSRTTGPFPTLSNGQWKEVLDAHGQFCSPAGLGRPLGVFSNASLLPDAAALAEPAPDVRLAGPPERIPEYDAAIRDSVVNAGRLIRSKHRRDGFPVVSIRRGFYGHSQRLSEPFGTRMVNKVVCGNAASEGGVCRALGPTRRAAKGSRTSGLSGRTESGGRGMRADDGGTDSRRASIETEGKS